MEFSSMELINRGSIVSCQTCFNQTIEGGVMAFDPTTKILILKCAADSGQAKLNDVYVVNLELCSEVQIKQEVNTIPNAPPLLNIQRIATRKRNAVDEKRRQVLALTAGVTPEGQRLFMSISKTIGSQVTWKGSDIVVFEDTFITQPYRPENVSGPCERRTGYVKKLVENQWKVEGATTAAAAVAAAATAPATGPAATTTTPAAAATTPVTSGEQGVNSNNNNNNNGAANSNGTTSINTSASNNTTTAPAATGQTSSTTTSSSSSSTTSAANAPAAATPSSN